MVVLNSNEEKDSGVIAFAVVNGSILPLPSINVEVRGLTKLGKIIDCSVNCASVIVNGNIGVLVVVNNIGNVTGAEVETLKGKLTCSESGKVCMDDGNGIISGRGELLTSTLSVGKIESGEINGEGSLQYFASYLISSITKIPWFKLGIMAILKKIFLII